MFSCRLGALLMSLLLLLHCGGETGSNPDSGAGSGGSGSGSGGGSNSDTTAPTVSSLKTAAGTTIESTGTTAISVASTYLLTFSEAMDTNRVSTSNVTLSCNSASQTITIAEATDSDSISKNEFTITPIAQLPQFRSCTATVGTGVKDAAGNALATEKTFIYTTRCTTNDDFGNSDTLNGCWTGANTNLLSANDVANGVLSLTVAGSTATGSDLTAVPMYRKSFASGSAAVTATVRLPTFSGVENATDGCGLALIDPADGVPRIHIEIYTNGANSLEIGAFKQEDGSSVNAGSVATGTSASALSGTLYFRLTLNGSTVSASYRLGDSGSFTSLGSLAATVGSSYAIGLGMINVAGSNNLNCQFDDFVVDANATGQD